MEAEIIKGEIGQIGKYDLAFKEGQLVLELDALLGKSSAGLVLRIDAKDVLEAIKKAIPGQIDDAVINVLEAALLPLASIASAEVLSEPAPVSLAAAEPAISADPPLDVGPVA